MSYRHCAFLATIPHFFMGLLTLTSPFVGAQQPAAQEAGDTPAQAKQIARTSNVKETLSSASDIDFFKFKITKDSKNPEKVPSGNLTVTFSQKAPPGNNSKSGWRIDLYNENDLANNLYTVLWPETRLTNKFELGLGTGTYYYRVSSIDNTVFPAAEYSFKGSWEESPYYEKEPNDSDTATAITVNEMYYGNLSSDTDMDFYRFSLQNADSVTIAFSQSGPGSDDKSGWNVSLLGDSNSKPLEVLSTQQSATLQANLQAGEHYLRIAPFFPEEIQCEEGTSESTSKKESVEKKGPIGRGYQIFVNAASVPLPPKECASVITYGQNPVTLRWVSFPTPCEVPVGWHNTTAIPEGFQTCPVCSAIPHAKYTLNDQGLLDIPFLDLFDASGSNLGLYSVQLQGVPGPSPSEFKLLGATPKATSTATSTTTVPSTTETSPTVPSSTEVLPSSSEGTVIPPTTGN